jgi:hypothetical protein
MSQKTSHLSPEAQKAVKEGEEIRKSLSGKKKSEKAEKKSSEVRITEASTHSTNDGVIKSEQTDIDPTVEEKK